MTLPRTQAPCLLARRLLAVLVAAALVGCTSNRPLPDGWEARAHELHSRHFDVVTDVPVELAPRLVDAAEHVHAEHHATFGGAPLARIQLRVFADQLDFGRYHGLDLPTHEELAAERQRLEEAGYQVLGTYVETPAGHYRRSLLGHEEVALFHQGDLEGALRHELAHVFLRLRLPRPPAWLDEGVAEYVRLERDPRRRAGMAAGLEALVGDGADLVDMLGWSHARLYEEGARGYAMAWLLVDRLVRVEGVLDLRAPVSAGEAARAMLARVSTADLVADARGSGASPVPRAQ
jgi:hypothetical protein